jgi:hypothetical protein
MNISLQELSRDYMDPVDYQSDSIRLGSLPDNSDIRTDNVSGDR